MPGGERKYAIVGALSEAAAICYAGDIAFQCDHFEPEPDSIETVVCFGPFNSVATADARACWIFDQEYSGAIPFDIESVSE